ncbi:MAG: uracil-DNA glycosylase [Candidatus Eremiobacteraeota bacterium]|nr:uracil-DNA glycosylase [Candidatus Eremiobacteraeota bacterium]
MKEKLEEINARVVRCTLCPQLRRYCSQIGVEKKRAYRDWAYWARPVPSFGDPEARVMIVGLAPGAHGSNRTGRMFTGDGSGAFLYRALYRGGFANQPYAVQRDDGLTLKDCIITAALRCAPPGNKPTPQELRNCFQYLREEFAALEKLRVLVALGAIALKAIVLLLKDAGYSFEASRTSFGHAAEFVAARDTAQMIVVSSFHPSQQNTNTGKLTEPMFDAIFERVRLVIDAP